MTTIYNAAKFVETSEPAPRVSFMRRCWRTFQVRRERERLRAVLHRLPDRELKDIGITRSEIEYLVLNGSDVLVDLRRHGRFRTL